MAQLNDTITFYLTSLKSKDHHRNIITNSDRAGSCEIYTTPSAASDNAAVADITLSFSDKQFHGIWSERSETPNWACELPVWYTEKYAVSKGCISI